MGHQVVYFASVPQQAVCDWLDELAGFYCSEPGDSTTDWEGELASGGAFWARMVAEACRFSLAMNYSGLFAEWPPALDLASRFESEFWGRLGPVPLLRADEFLVNEWSAATRQEWWQSIEPVSELSEWLRSQESHWHWLVPKPSPA